MQKPQTRWDQALARAYAWLVDHLALFAGSDNSATVLRGQITALRDTLARIAESEADTSVRKEQSKLVAQDEMTVRKHLREVDLKAIVDKAKALRGQVPGMATFTIPASTAEPGRLLTDAIAIRKLATVYEQVFVEHGLPTDFLARLDQSISALQASVTARVTAVARRSDAKQSVAADLELGKQLVALMDSSMRHLLANDPQALASWRLARRVHAKPKPSQVSAPAETSTIAPIAPSGTTNAG